ncbi:MAG: hypothetical protein LBP76_04085, partial [Treponema sp.]|nr:hypothetical protein [Treponema sp.]
MSIALFSDDFSQFPLGPFPYDPEHSAMGEYHFILNPGFTGAWYDPIASFRYRGPSWLVSAPFMDGRRCMEQMRIDAPAEKTAIPTLAAGDPEWTDYTVQVRVRFFTALEGGGFLFRYQTSLMHYAFFLVPGGAEILRVMKGERTVLARGDYAWNNDSFYELQIQVEGSRIRAYIDGEKVLECSDSLYARGCIALSSCMPAQYMSVKVAAEEEAALSMKNAARIKQQNIEKKYAEHARPVLWKQIDLQDFGAGRQIRFGHLTGTEELFFVICQHQRRIFKDRYPFISCMTA